MEHMGGSVDFLAKARSSINNGLEHLRTLLPDLAAVEDAEITAHCGDLYDYVKIKRKCSKCIANGGFPSCWRDDEARGWIKSLRIVDGQIRFENLMCGPRKAHDNRLMVERLLIESGLTAESRKLTFDNFPSEQRVKHQELYDFMREFAAKYSGGPAQGAYICGPPGVAKTHAAVALTFELADRGVPVIFVRGDKLKAQLYKAMQTEEDSLDALIERYSTIPVLIIDEFAQETISEWAFEKVNAILNARYSDGLPTFFTSNFEPFEVYETLRESSIQVSKKVDSLRSRLYVMSLLAPVGGDDHRMTNLRNALRPSAEVNGHV